MGRATVTAERARELFEYDPQTGAVYHRTARGGAKIGQPAGTERKDGYWQLSADNHRVLRHRLAWLMTFGDWPTAGIDHINMVRGDDRIDNLRPATQSENGANTRARRSNRSTGVKGVYRVPGTRRFRAMIMRGRKSAHIGYFDTIADAHAAYLATAEQLFGRFANGGTP